MQALEELSALIGDVYDASLDLTLWPRVLERIASWMQGPAAALVSHDVSSSTGGFHFSWGDDPHYTALYFKKYIRLNPTIAALAMIDVGDVRSISDVMPFEEFRRSRLFKEWAGPQRYGDATIAMIEKSATVMTHLTAVHYDRNSPVGEQARQRLRIIVPHLRRAVAIAKVIDLHKIEAVALADAIDAIAAGVFLIGPDLNIVRVNVSGRAMLDEHRILRADDGKLVAVDPAAGVALRQAVAGAASGDDLAIGGRPPAVLLHEGSGGRYVMHILPLGAGRRREARAHHAAVAALFVHRAALDSVPPLEAIARQYVLTPGELRVLVAIVEVGGVREVAAVLGIAETTVKTHLRHLFEKTGASRQADLVKIVAAFSNPMIT